MLRIFIGQAVSRKKKRKKFKMDFIEEAFKLETGIEATNHSLHSVSHHLVEEIPSDQNYAGITYRLE